MRLCIKRGKLGNGRGRSNRFACRNAQWDRQLDDVIIVGGGPTGFITALGLAQAGVRLTVIESEPQIVDSPRAAVYHWSVVEGLEKLGIREEVEKTGFPKQDYTYLVHKTGERIDFSLEVLNGLTPYPYNLHLGQHRLAEIALRRLAGHAQTKVRFNTRLTQLQQDAGGVTLQVMTPDGPEEMRAKWVIGADGASSTVRRQLSLDFDGMTWPERFVATNVYFDFERYQYARATFLIDDRHGAVIAKLDNTGLWRCTYMEDAGLPEESVIARLPQAYDAIVPNADYSHPTRDAVSNASKIGLTVPGGTRGTGGRCSPCHQSDRRPGAHLRAVRLLRPVSGACRGHSGRRGCVRSGPLFGFPAGTSS